MKAFALLVISILCVGCAATRERAVTIATASLANRKLLLPTNYTVHVEQGFANFELQPPYDIWVVEFRAPGRKDPLYSFYIDQRNGRIDDFTDYRRRRTVPSRI
jgi:hypothetical protein